MRAQITWPNQNKHCQAQILQQLQCITTWNISIRKAKHTFKYYNELTKSRTFFCPIHLSNWHQGPFGHSSGSQWDNPLMEAIISVWRRWGSQWTIHFNWHWMDNISVNAFTDVRWLDQLEWKEFKLDHCSQLKPIIPTHHRERKRVRYSERVCLRENEKEREKGRERLRTRPQTVESKVESH